MPSHTRSHIVTVLAFLLALSLLAGCGGSDGGSSGPTQPRSVSGSFVKGPVSGASVSLHALVDADTPGAVRGGPFTTGADGAWSGEIPGGTNGPFLLVATGGSYVDESSGQTVQIGATQFLGYSANGPGVVTPFTHALAGAAAVRGGSPTSAWASVVASFETAFGFDPTTTTASLGGGTGSKTYLALLGGLSTLVDSNPALSGLAGAARADLIWAASQDLSDGKLDGRTAAGATISVPVGGGGSQNWPALDPTGLGVLIDAVNAWVQTVEGLEDFSLDPTVLDFGGGTGGTGSGTLNFSGPAASLLPSATFTPTGFSSNAGGIAWASANGAGYAVSIGLSRSTTNGARASLLSITVVNLQQSYGWSLSNFGPGIAGVTLDGNTATFEGVTLPAILGTDLSLTVSGVLGE